MVSRFFDLWQCIIHNIYEFVKYCIDRAIKISAPIVLEILPSLLFIFFPINSPMIVKVKLNNEKVVQHNICLWLIRFIPTPATKESILTKNAIVINDISVVNIPLLELFLSNNINNPSNKNIEKVIYLVSILINLSIKSPNTMPIKGIKKWNKPTNIENINISLYFILNVPKHNDKEKASMLKLIATKTIDSI
jgi:hypothetical protein